MVIFVFVRDCNAVYPCSNEFINYKPFIHGGSRGGKKYTLSKLGTSGNEISSSGSIKTH